MKILVINWRDIENPESGGAEIHIDQILKRKPSGWQVDFVSASFKNSKKTQKIHGYCIIRIPNNALFNFTFRKYWEKTLSKNGYQLIIDDISKIPLATPRYIKNTPILAIQHHIHGKSLFSQLFFPFAFYVYWMERFLLKYYVQTPLIAVSESTRNELQHLYPFKNIKISHNGIDIAPHHPSRQKSKKDVILYLGRLKKYKRIDHILRAFQKVHILNPESELWLAGKGDNEGVLRKLTTKLNLNSSVRFLGYVSEKQKTAILSKATLSVITSEKEGWGISVIEANAAGLPVIGYDVEGVRDSIKHNYSGILVPDGNIEKLSEQITHLLRNHKQRQKLSKNAIRWASRFSWDNMAKEFYKIAKKLVKKTRSS